MRVDSHTRANGESAASHGPCSVSFLVAAPPNTKSRNHQQPTRPKYNNTAWKRLMTTSCSALRNMLTGRTSWLRCPLCRGSHCAAVGVRQWCTMGQLRVCLCSQRRPPGRAPVGATERCPVGRTDVCFCSRQWPPGPVGARQWRTMRQFNVCLGSRQRPPLARTLLGPNNNANNMRFQMVPKSP
jgi:hypothetical protein